MESDPYALVDVPSVAEYKSAFNACKSALKSSDGTSLVLDMLRANYQAADHTVTAGELASQVGLPSYKEANRRYANFAKALCKELHRDPKIKIAVLLKFSGGKPGTRPDQDESMRWTLLPEVVTALEESWFSHLKPD